MTPLPLAQQAVLTANALRNLANKFVCNGWLAEARILKSHAEDLLASVEAEKVKHERA